METLYTFEEVAKTLKLSVHAIRDWRKKKKINVVKIGNSVRVTQSELNRLMKGE